jgi:glucose 1-dehydrogenase
MSDEIREKWLEGQTAIVTGGSRGIGAAIVKELALRGANTVINYKSNREEALQVAREIEEMKGCCQVIQADISEAEDVEKLVDEAVNEFSFLDIMVTNAGIQRDESLLDMSLDQWEQVMAVNLTGQFLCSQQAAKIFTRQGIRKDVSRAAGKIVNMSSVHEEIPWAFHVNYAAAKGGVQMLMRSMAQELASSKIRVNGIAPGAIRTDINRDVWADPQKEKQLLELIPYGRIGDVGDVSSVVSWLCSDKADYITGATIYIDGGMSLYPGFIGGG